MMLYFKEYFQSWWFYPKNSLMFTIMLGYKIPPPHSVPPLGGGWKTSHPTDLRGVLIRTFILGVCFRDILVPLQNPPPLVNKRSYALAFCYPWGCILYCIQSNWVNVNKMIRGKLPNTHLKLFINRPCVKNNGWEFCSFIGISFFFKLVLCSIFSHTCTVCDIGLFVKKLG